MNANSNFTIYHETITKKEHLLFIHSKLKAKGFIIVENGYWTETWENPTTEEVVIVTRSN